ncbi:dienelactone hydrolase family protein [Mangrovivirga sp. M17]|uniref:Dienelactone hydrolase family protein n=1 Tax=Mangrovivirga halotolerans TaxID=2993936 RepID=A0ABT3RQX8_9BACT|nr:dienelactone hydrolase family protein [Mangrovivirga halotolerans]MCX2744182.1 dienelactone hydrolase family protein [Mangrovivirga halotolerans]
MIRTNQIILIFAFLLIVSSCGQKSDDSGSFEETSEEAAEDMAESIATEEVTYETDTTSMVGYIAYNESIEDKRPGIIIVHEWWGHNEYVRERADMLAGLGYTAMAIDMYGNGKQAAHPEDAQKFSGMVMSNIDAAQARFKAAMDMLKDHHSVDSSKIAAIGYCFGGSVVLTMANAGMDLDAVAAFHSGVQLPIMPNEDLTAKVLVCNGAADPFVTPESVAAFTSAMDEIKADYKYVAYEGAKHAFTSKGADSLGQKFELPLEYNAEADEQSWDELQELLNETFN